MPALLQAKCDSCRYRARGSQSQTSLVLDNGSEMSLPHPGEADRAQEQTGKSLQELAKENRLLYRYGMVCRTCGIYAYYLNPRAKSVGHIGAIVGAIEQADGDEMECVHCSHKGLQSTMGEQIGCLPLLLGKRPKPNVFDCPKCKKGRVEITMFART